MNEHKLKSLFRAARKAPAPELAPGFDHRVMGALEREELAQPVPWTEQLEQWWARVAFGAALVIALCVVVDFGLAGATHIDLSSSLAEVSEQWLFATD